MILQRKFSLCWTSTLSFCLAYIAGVLIAYVAFGNGNIKAKAESFLGSITDTIAVVLKHNVEVRIGLLPEKYLKATKSLSNSPSSRSFGHVESDRIHGLANMPRKSVDRSKHKLLRTEEMNGIQEQSARKRSIDERKLENAWLEASDNVEAQFASSNSKEFNHRTNYNIPETDANSLGQIKSLPDLSISFKHWGDGESDEIQELETNDSQICQKERVGRRVETYRHAMSPSLLHSKSFRAKFDQESL